MLEFFPRAQQLLIYLIVDMSLPTGHFMMLFGQHRGYGYERSTTRSTTPSTRYKTC